MIQVYIGHRGVGKSSLGRRFLEYRTSCKLIDLDREIERERNKSISSIFKEEGEAIFRKVEGEVFLQIYNSFRESDKLVVIILGAGFEFDIPKDCEVTFIRRETDSAGRSFFNRPRLLNKLSPLEEYKVKFELRENRFLALADQIYTIPEGLSSANPIEKSILCEEFDASLADISLLPIHLKKDLNFEKLQKRKFRRIEVRDDLIDLDSLSKVVGMLPKSNLLLSFRDPKKVDITNSYTKYADWIDWPLEMGTAPSNVSYNILSLHEKKVSVKESIGFLEDQARSEEVILKLAIEIESFEELAEGHLWHKKNPKKNCFLPRSKTGRWSWYRLLLKNSNPINFIREGAGSSLDQPSLFAFLNFDVNFSEFAAILGSPIVHSLSPMEHDIFFKQKSANFLSLDLTQQELTKDILNLLFDLGLRYAAVTSPLKNTIFELCDLKTEVAQNLASVNSIKFDSGKWVGHNTDIDGLLALKNLVDPSIPPVIWGGGGTLSALQSIFPIGIPFSARTGLARKGNVDDFQPKELIWASGNLGKAPNINWKLKKIIDLSYSESSRAREFAVENNIEYISGLIMFKQQALKQREFWNGCE